MTSYRPRSRERVCCIVIAIEVDNHEKSTEMEGFVYSSLQDQSKDDQMKAKRKMLNTSFMILLAVEEKIPKVRKHGKARSPFNAYSLLSSIQRFSDEKDSEKRRKAEPREVGPLTQYHRSPTGLPIRGHRYHPYIAHPGCGRRSRP